jgi:glycosyltransferase involved in cell wall biosynthesis
MRVLVSAYACEPNRGSEPGVGWGLTTALAGKHDVWVITRANNRAAVEAAIPRELEGSLHFVYVDLPRWATFWKRGKRGVRPYYVLWQLRAGLTARSLHREDPFDVVHHLTFANMWFPALACLADAPFVLGPTAGGQRVPLRLLPLLGVGSGAWELASRVGRIVMRANPFVRIAWRRAWVILVNNEETSRAFPRAFRSKVSPRIRTYAYAVRPTDTVRARRDSSEAPLAICAGRLNRFKGVSIAIKAIARVPDWQLEIIGSGPDETRLRRLVRAEGVEARVRFIANIPQGDLWDHLARARALVLPTLKEGASFVAAEAQHFGVPVVALDQGGPAALARCPGSCFKLVSVGTEASVISGFADALRDLASEPAIAFDADFGLDSFVREVEAAYAEALSRADPKSAPVLA